MRKLGQHFLKNKSALRKIAGALELKPGDAVIEIGAGHGELTSEISNFQFSRPSQGFGGQAIFKENAGGIKIVSIEKDGSLAKFLREKFAGEKNIEIIEGDALKILPPIVGSLDLQIENRKWKLAGNIPYYITGRLLRIIGELKNKPSLCVFTVQKEVAERVVARPPNTNRLAAIVQFWANPEIIARLPREDFSPPPEVESAIIKLETRKQKIENRSSDYYKTIHCLFAQPRKTILNNLAMRDPEPLRYGAGMRRMTRPGVAKKLEKIGINPQWRPQNLTIEEIKKIADLFS